MTFAHDVSNILWFSFSWVKNKDYLKLYAIFGIIYFFLNLFDATSFAKLFEFPAGIFFSIFVVLTILTAFAFLVYFSLKLLYDVLATRFSNLRPFNLSTIIGLIITSFLSICAGLLSVFEPKWLLLLLVSAFFAAGALLSISNTIISLILGAFAALLVFLYLAIVMRNFARLTPVACFYLQGKGVLDSIKETWIATSGKALKIFAILLVQGVIITVLALVQAIPTLAAGIGDAVLLLVGLPLKPFSAVVAAIVSPASLFIQYFFYVGIYSWVREKSIKKK